MASGHRLVALLGYPLGHSLSPLIHNTSFRSQGLPFVYELRATPREALTAAIEQLKHDGFAGANVTVPHKSSVVPFLDHATDMVRATGAANTLVFDLETGRLSGDNTDVRGFLDTLKDASQHVQNAIIFGAGGAARAVVYGLLTGSSVDALTIVARNQERGEALVESLRFAAGTIALSTCAPALAGKLVRAADLLVNATPAGMHPAAHDTPWPADSDFGTHQVVYDLIYNPTETRFLQEAKNRGARTINGMAMLVRQADLSYRQWTGRPLDIERVRSALADAGYHPSS